MDLLHELHLQNCFNENCLWLYNIGAGDGLV